MVAISRWWMVCVVCSAARLSTPAPPEPLPHLYASANQLLKSSKNPFPLCFCPGHCFEAVNSNLNLVWVDSTLTCTLNRKLLDEEDGTWGMEPFCYLRCRMHSLLTEPLFTKQASLDRSLLNGTYQ